ncbi:MAG: hypothetical protein Q8S00_02235, partial [Deltaproteobacteria bacterium]|nr:hypothetical protein [Deltaproteobacteria bacterium]
YVLRKITQLLIDAKAWGKQLQRLQDNYSIRQALVGWLDTTKRLISTRQMDRRLALISEARKLMKKCAAAVPVWIMPISIMAESFDPPPVTAATENDGQMLLFSQEEWGKGKGAPSLILADSMKGLLPTTKGRGYDITRDYPTQITFYPLAPNRR